MAEGGAGAAGEVPATLAAAFAAVRAALAEAPAAAAPESPGAPSSGDSPSPRVNAKGDRVHAFDLCADRAAREVLVRGLGSGELLSEEAPPRRFGAGPPRWRVVLDPVDGSSNRARGLPLSALAIAVLPADAPLASSAVQFSLVGPLEGDAPFLAVRGAGAHAAGDGPALAGSGVRRLEEALVSCELNHWAPDPRLAGLLGRARGVRSYACASRALALVACGALDCHVDVRGRLTPESFLAAGLLVEEAGGVLLDARGRSPGPFHSLLARTTLLAAATPQLAREVLDALAAP